MPNVGKGVTPEPKKELRIRTLGWLKRLKASTTDPAVAHRLSSNSRYGVKSVSSGFSFQIAKEIARPRSSEPPSSLIERSDKPLSPCCLVNCIGISWGKRRSAMNVTWAETKVHLSRPPSA